MFYIEGKIEAYLAFVFVTRLVVLTIECNATSFNFWTRFFGSTSNARGLKWVDVTYFGN